MAILHQITVGKKKILVVDADPSTGGGIAMDTGSLALMNDGSGTFLKNGAGDTAWAKTVNKFATTTNFDIAVAKTITHNLNTTMIQVILWNALTGLSIAASVLGVRTANTVDITMAATLASVDVIIMG